MEKVNIKKLALWILVTHFYTVKDYSPATYSTAHVVQKAFSSLKSRRNVFLYTGNIINSQCIKTYDTMNILIQ